jgi:hypothetical protein
MTARNLWYSDTYDPSRLDFTVQQFEERRRSLQAPPNDVYGRSTQVYVDAAGARGITAVAHPVADLDGLGRDRQVDRARGGLIIPEGEYRSVVALETVAHLSTA